MRSRRDSLDRLRQKLNNVGAYNAQAHKLNTNKAYNDISFFLSERRAPTAREREREGIVHLTEASGKLSSYPESLAFPSVKLPGQVYRVVTPDTVNIFHHR